MVSKTYLLPLLVVGMLVTGISNSLLNKYQDLQCVGNCNSKDPKKHIEFSQPVWQTLQMFLGECLCLIPVFTRLAYTRLTRKTQANAEATKPLLAEEVAPSESAVLVFSDNSPRSRLGGTDSAMTSYEATRSRVHMVSTPASTAQVAAGTQASEIDSRIVLPGGDGDGSTINDSSYIDPRDYMTIPYKGPSLPTKAMGLFFMPALCDICGTTLMNVGLLFTPVSIYQMTRGALVLWVGVFSVIFLRRSLRLFQWLSLLAVMMGVTVVGLSGTILKAPEGNNLGSNEDDELPESAQALLGVLLILFAQIFTASQFVLEEKIMSRYKVEPLLAVGCEGFFGAATTLLIMPFLHYFVGSTPEGKGGFFDMSAGWHQILHIPAILYSTIAICFTIAFFNFFGLSVTRNVSATARSTIDTCRTLGIWIVSLKLGWETFHLASGSLQVLGFCLVVYGTFLFNGIIPAPQLCIPASDRHQYAALDHPRHDEDESDYNDSHF